MCLRLGAWMIGRALQPRLPHAFGLGDRRMVSYCRVRTRWFGALGHGLARFGAVGRVELCNRLAVAGAFGEHGATS